MLLSQVCPGGNLSSLRTQGYINTGTVCIKGFPLTLPLLQSVAQLPILPHSQFDSFPYPFFQCTTWRRRGSVCDTLVTLNLLSLAVLEFWYYFCDKYYRNI